MEATYNICYKNESHTFYNFDMLLGAIHTYLNIFGKDFEENARFADSSGYNEIGFYKKMIAERWKE